MIFRNIEFEGPFPVDSELPASSGIYMICTESAGGFRFIGVYGADDMSVSFRNNPWKDDWKNHDDRGLLVFYTLTDCTASQRESAVRGIIDTRCYDVPCVDRIQDDW